jgi:hypothetical protein
VIVLCLYYFDCAEYLLHAGYLRADTMPAKYSVAKPELVLEVAGVLTEGVVDPAALQCKDKQKVHLSMLVDWSGSVKDIAGATIESVLSSEIITAEKAVKGDNDAGPLTTRHNTMNEAQTVEASWA